MSRHAERRTLKSKSGMPWGKPAYLVTSEREQIRIQALRLDPRLLGVVEIGCLHAVQATVSTSIMAMCVIFHNHSCNADAPLCALTDVYMQHPTRKPTKD